MIQPAPPPNERISRWWWLLPIFLSWVGGLIDYLIFKDKNPRTAKKMLIVGIVMVAVTYAIVFGFFFLLFLFPRPVA